jgi:predicted restriction endonuclease
MNRYQLAASVGNANQRKKALDNYYKNPNLCLCCGTIIQVSENQKVSEVRKKTFCDRKCSTIFNNKKRVKKEKSIQKNDKKQKFDYILNLTKNELYNKHGIYYKFRAVIRKHAHFVYWNTRNEKKCSVCGYDKFIEVCHIKSVSSFDDDAKIRDINNTSNLIGLCPNHHKEFDNGLLKLMAGGQVGI